ncbi:MAG TPA: SDR family NAD(P)-dependent oxidoreductase [Pseudolabrys sp.]|nr:SDR family NAD(P)-dependent oxidoreductase [Pseudolabrys sp.]
MESLAGRHALVTGGGRGIGRSVAATLTKAGAKVTVLGRQEGPLKDAVAKGQASAYAIADVADAGAITDAAKRAAADAGPIDILIANAGITGSAPFARTTPDQFRSIFDINVMGVVHSIQAVLGGMIARRFGRIVVMSSTAGLKGYAYVSAYAASKHAVVGLVRSLALETAKSGVTVNAVCPSYTDTEMVHDDMARAARKSGRTPDDVLAAILKDKPLGRLIKPEEVAAAVLYLCSSQAAAVTGTTLTVAGGEV